MTEYLSQEVDFYGSLNKMLRDLRGFSTLANELIQNADDAPGVDCISFDIRDDGLYVSNNGVFRGCDNVNASECTWQANPLGPKMCDFHRLRRIAGGDKREEEGSTGAFGIGFVSVYQISDRPELWSADRHWVIDPSAESGRRIQQDYAPASGDTRFFFPWARNEKSKVRELFGLEAMSDEKVIQLEAEIRGLLPDVILFLRKLTKIELLAPNKPPLIAERKLNQATSTGDGALATVLLSDGTTETLWHIAEGDFDESATHLRQSHPGRIERKRRSSVTLALPGRDRTIDGLFWAFLPTEQSTGLPFHINADFFPSSDRKKIIFDSTYQQLWNEAAITAAAKALAASLLDLRTHLGVGSLWGLIESLSIISYQASSGKRDPAILARFWADAQEVIRNNDFVLTVDDQWLQPSKVYYFVQKVDDSELVTLFRVLNLPTVSPILRRYQNLLLGIDIGVNTLTASVLADAIRRSGLTTRCQLNDARAWFQDPTFREILGRCITSFTSSPTDREHAKQVFRDCPIAIAADGWAKFPHELFIADADALETFMPFVGGEDFVDPQCPPAIVELCGTFDVAGAVDMLETVPTDVFVDMWHDNPESIIRLIRWFAARGSQTQAGDKLADRLAALPIWPSKHSVHPLDELALPVGSFADPLELANVADMTKLHGLRDFLSSLGAKDLSIVTYARDQVPIAFGEKNISPEARRLLLTLLAEHLGVLRNHPDIQPRLASLPLVDLADGSPAQANQTYLDTQSVREILGPRAKIATLPDSHSDSATEFLKWLGVDSDPRPLDILNQIRAVTALDRSKGVEFIQRIFVYLARVWPTASPTFKATLEPLRRLEWLPGSRDHRWHPPSNLYTAFNRSLIESQADILEIDVRHQQEAKEFLTYLGVQQSPKTELIVEHLLYCSERNIDINRQFYLFLSYDVYNQSILKLRKTRSIWLRDGQFTLPSHCFWNDSGFGRYRTHLGEDWRDFTTLFTHLRVREGPDWEDAIAVLGEIAVEFTAQDSPIDDETYAATLECWRQLSAALLKNPADLDEVLFALGGRHVIPDDRRFLQRPADLFFEDRPGLAQNFQHILDARIIPYYVDAWQAMAKAGVRPISHAIRRTLVERGHTIVSDLAARIVERSTLIARVLESHPSDALDTGTLDRLSDLQVIQATDLQVIFTLNDRDSHPSTDRQPVFAFYDPESTTLYFQVRDPEDTTPPWPAIARELASALSPAEEPGPLATALKEVLSAPTLAAAETILDELGYAPLRSVFVPAPVALVASLGEGESGAADSALPPDTAGHLPLPFVDTADEPLRSTNGHEQNGLSSTTEGLGFIPDDTAISPSPSSPGTDSAGELTTDPIGRPFSTVPRNPTASHPEPQMPAETSSPGSRSGRRTTYALPPTEETHTPAPTHRDTKLEREIDEVGIERVLEHERKFNRVPREMPHNHPGYDIESTDESGDIRYIEVKSTGTDWNDFGVALSDTQFSTARKLGPKYWLYVVERALSNDAAPLRIQDPANRPSEFAYDGGWRNYAETDEP